MPTDSTKKLLTWGSAVNTSGKIADFLDGWSLNPIPNRLGHVTYNERADSALTW